jgi:hypothetical protein
MCRCWCCDKEKKPRISTEILGFYGFYGFYDLYGLSAAQIKSLKTTKQPSDF